MALVIGDMQSVGTAGWWYTSDATGSAPATPTLSVVNDGDGDAVTATVSGDAGVTNQLLYKKSVDTAWITGATRFGDGAIAQAGLDNDTGYDFIVVAEDSNYYSYPSAQVTVNVNDGISALLVDLPQAIVNSLNAASFSKTFTATRAAVPLFARKEMSTLRVTVVPRKLDIAMLSRADDNHDVQVDVAVQSSLDEITNTAIDPFLDLAEELTAHLTRLNMSAGSSDYLWVKSENEPIYSPEHIRELHQFTSVITITYREIK